MKSAPLGDALGVELVDFDISRPCDAAEQAELRSLFTEHHLILVRTEGATDQDHDNFCRYFGPLSLMLNGEEAGYVTNRGERTYGPGTRRLLWHADGTYGEHPGIATSLWAKDVGEGAASTAFLNAARALDTLSPALRNRIEHLTALHMRDLKTENTEFRVRIENMVARPEPGRYRSCEHPIVYRAPHLDRDVLFVNELSTSHIVELPGEQGEPLLLTLFEHLRSKDNVYTHEWRTGDLLIWDNIVLQHCRPSEVGMAARHLRRLTLDGWNTSGGVLDWVATGGLRDPAVAGSR